MTTEELQKMYKRTPERQINVAISKMLEAIRDTEGRIHLSFSGGKDSCLLADLYCDVLSGTPYRDLPVNLDFADTTNETAAMLKHVDYFPEYLEKKYGLKIQLNKYRPKKGRTWAKTIRSVGVPLVSKQTAKSIRRIASGMARTKTSKDEIIKLYTSKCEEQKVRELEERGFKKSEILALTGYVSSNKCFSQQYRVPRKWLPLAFCPVAISDKCCGMIKEASLPNCETMTGEMAHESLRRQTAYLKTGCNFILENGMYKSKPLGPMTKQGVLFAIKSRNIPLCEDYGEIIPDGYGGLKCSKCDRTGCALCGFGAQFDTDRFLRVAETEAAKIAFAFKPYDQGGAGYKEACEYMNEYCGTKIRIP